MTVLHMCCQGGHVGILEELLSHPNVDVARRVNPGGESPLDLALEYGHLGVVARLLRHQLVLDSLPEAERVCFLNEDGDSCDRVWGPQGDDESWRRLTRIACFRGHLTLLSNLLLRGRSQDINQPLDTGMTLLQTAATVDQHEVAAMLLRRPGIDPNLRGKGTTQPPLLVAASCGSQRVFRLLLQDARVEVRRGSLPTQGVLRAACLSEDTGILALVAFSPRFNLNESLTTSISSPTPLWVSASKGLLPSVKVVLASRMVLNTVMAGGGGRVADIARTLGHEEVAALIEEYEGDSARVRARVWQEMRLGGELAAALFALVVCLCDDLLLLPPLRKEEKKGRTSQALTKQQVVEKGEERGRRFFALAARLPLELQMVLCNAVYGMAADLIPAHQRETGFRNFAELERQRI